MKKFLSSLILLAAFAIGLQAQAAPAKYIFYYIGDGMGNGHIMATNTYLRMVHNMDPLLMSQFPIEGQATTFSASSPVTDSAAAGTALATGTKTLNNMLGMSPDSIALTSIADILHNNGYGVGIVTSVSPDDATPGAFYAHQPSRKNFYEIGVEAAKSDFEFIGGSNLRGVKDKKGRPTDLVDVFTRNNVTIVHGTEEMKQVTNRRVMYVNSDTILDNTLGYTIDSIPTGVKLTDMTLDCLNHLERVAPDRFFMMVEGGNIDHAAHSNDAGAVIKEIMKFDESLRIAYDFYLQHPDETLIVVTADHNTGGPSVGNLYLHYNANLAPFDSQRISKDVFANEIKAMLKSRRAYTWDEMKEYLTDKLGFWTPAVPIDDRMTEILHQSFINTFEHHDGKSQEALYNSYPQFAVDVFSILQDITGIGWTTTKHVGNRVPVYAIGTGSDLFQGGMDNTTIPYRILNAAGLLQR